MNLLFLVFLFSFFVWGSLFTPLGYKTTTNSRTRNRKFSRTWKEKGKRWRNKVFVSEVDDAGIGRQGVGVDG